MSTVKFEIVGLLTAFRKRKLISKLKSRIDAIYLAGVLPAFSISSADEDVRYVFDETSFSVHSLAYLVGNDRKGYFLDYVRKWTL